MSAFKDRLKLILSLNSLGKTLAILVCFLLAGYSLWYTSVGKFPTFPKIGKDNYYVPLGEAFLRGQLSLLEKPSSELIALKNPYSYKQRQNVPYQFDYSYYQGKYYLYWGPVPGLVFAVVEGIIHSRPPNALVTVTSYIGLSFLLLIILIQFRSQFYPAAPSFSLWLFVLAGLINIPFLFLLGRLEIYETSIIAGQFFLFMGISSWLMYTKTEKAFWLTITGLGLGLALGSRYDLGVSIMLFTGFALITLGQETGWRHFEGKLGSFLAPLALCFLGLGIYNFARFGNPLQTGLNYQLTVPVSHYFLISYIPSNLYAYLFPPLNVVNKFPFIKASIFSAAQLPEWVSSLSAGQQFDPVMVGLFSSIPMVWLFALAIPLAITLLRQNKKSQTPYSARLAFFVIIFAAAAAQFAFLLVYYYGAMRFLGDFYLLFVLITVMLVWRMDESLQAAPGIRICFWILVTGLALWTVALGFFGGFSVPPQLLQHYNPNLYTQLASYWNNSYQSFRTIYDSLGIPKILHFIRHG